MLVWIENAPTLEKNSEEEIVQFIDKHITCSADDAESAHLVELQTHKHSKTCIRSSLNAPKVFLKRVPNEMRINLFNRKILLAWKANLDIQIVLEPYGCASYVVGYISKSQRGMSAQLEAAAKEARKGSSDIKNK